MAIGADSPPRLARAEPLHTHPRHLLARGDDWDALAGLRRRRGIGGAATVLPVPAGGAGGFAAGGGRLRIWTTMAGADRPGLGGLASPTSPMAPTASGLRTSADATTVRQQLLAVLGASAAARTSTGAAPQAVAAPAAAAPAPAAAGARPRSGHGRAALLIDELISAVEREDVCAVMVLLASRTGALDVNGADQRGGTALHACATAGNMPIALLLLQKGAHADQPHAHGGCACASLPWRHVPGAQT